MEEITESREFQQIVEPMAKMLELRGKLGMQVTLDTDASRAMARYLRRLATMLDLQTDMLNGEQRIRELEAALAKAKRKLFIDIIRLTACGLWLVWLAWSISQMG